jgi:hypothetical protein
MHRTVFPEFCRPQFWKEVEFNEISGMFEGAVENLDFGFPLLFALDLKKCSDEVSQRSATGRI